MRQHLFKLFLLSLLCAAWSGRVGAETLGLTVVSESHAAPSARENTKAETSTKWRKQKANPDKLLLQKWKGKNGRKGWLILAIVLLSIGIIGFGMLGFVSLVVAIELIGDGVAIIIGIFALGGLGLSAAFIIFLIRTVKKLRRLKHGEPLPQDQPHRAPSKKANQQ